MVRIQDVAKRAGVSVATVSRYLNNPSIVAKKTRLKVDEAIKTLNYEPSLLGRNLRKQESKLLMVLIPGISNPFYADIIKGIEDRAIEQGFHILLCQTDANPEREDIYFNLIRNQLASGIITMDPTVGREKISKVANKYPVVQCSEYDPSGLISYVTIDNVKAAYDGVKYLIDQGHEKIALINSEETFLYSREREEGYRQAMDESGLEIHKDWITVTENLEFDSGRSTMKQLLNLKNRPTAVFAVSDILAIGAMHEVMNHGLTVPKDISVIGFDNISLSKMLNPQLTTVAQPMYEMGSLAAEMLMDKIQGKQTESLILDHALVIRESTQMYTGNFEEVM